MGFNRPKANFFREDAGFLTKTAVGLIIAVVVLEILPKIVLAVISGIIALGLLVAFANLFICKPARKPPF